MLTLPILKNMTYIVIIDMDVINKYNYLSISYNDKHKNMSVYVT